MSEYLDYTAIGVRANTLVEVRAHARKGLLPLVGGIVSLFVFIGLSIPASASGSINTPTSLIAYVFAVATLLTTIFLLSGLYTLEPNQAAVMTLFGAYRGTDDATGLRYANPLYTKTKVSRRVCNFNTQTSKVNDAHGNPILIGAVVVWQVTDTARAIFGVQSYVDYVQTQADSAVRQLARSYPYDAFDDPDATTLIGDTGQVNEHLRRELQERANEAGVTILEARITDLSYAPEIAEAMLRRQQASAIVAARSKIVEGSILMVRSAVQALEEGEDGKHKIPLSTERKAIFATNLVTVIASDSPTTPVINVGTEK